MLTQIVCFAKVLQKRVTAERELTNVHGKLGATSGGNVSGIESFDRKRHVDKSRIY